MKTDKVTLFSSLVAPALLIGTYLIWQLNLIASGSLPDLVANHWGITGKADGFTTPEVNLWLSLSVVAILWALFGWVSLSKKVPIYMRRIFSFGLLMLLGWILGLFALLTSSQIGITDPAQAQLPAPWLVSGLAMLILLVTLFAKKPVLKISNGLEVTSFGIPLLRLSKGEIAEVKPAFLRARDFGGWGIRFNGQAVAIIPNSGPGVEIFTTSGQRVLIRHNQPELVIQLLGKVSQ